MSIISVKTLSVSKMDKRHFWILILITRFVFAQETRLDSAKRELNMAKNDSVRCLIL